MNVTPFDRFITFTRKIESQKHISHGNGHHMRTKLYALKGQPNLQKDFFVWLKNAKKNKHLTLGNVKAIKAKFNKVFTNNIPTQQPTLNTNQQAQKLTSIAKTKKVVWFYDHNNKLTQIFGNFYKNPVTYKGITYACAEAAFQAQKCSSNKQKRKFANLTGDQAFKKAKTLTLPQNWHTNKFQIMKEIVTEKFKDPKLKGLLLATKGAELVEHNPVVGRDKTWSDNHDGSGENKLGIILMQVRQSLGGKGVVQFPQQYNQYVKNQ